MYNYQNSSPTLTNVTFSGNSARWGGGMNNDSSSPTLMNVTLSGNYRIRQRRRDVQRQQQQPNADEYPDRQQRERWRLCQLLQVR